MQRFVESVRKAFLVGYKKSYKKSYSQCGEDLLLDFYFSNRFPNQKVGKYIDIGAHHPTIMNNTYLFYKKGWRGINIEPVPEQQLKFKKQRPADINIMCGIGTASENKDFYIMDPPTLSTYDRKTAENYIELGHKIIRVDNVCFWSVSDLISKCGIKDNIDLLTIDIEGQELDIIQSFISKGIKPKTMICETLAYSSQFSSAQKEQDKIDAIIREGYFLYADTFINSIFISNECWNS